MPKVTLTQHRITVLLVDDQAIIGESVRRMLSTEQDTDFRFCQDPLQAIIRLSVSNVVYYIAEAAL